MKRTSENRMLHPITDTRKSRNLMGVRKKLFTYSNIVSSTNTSLQILHSENRADKEIRSQEEEEEEEVEISNEKYDDKKEEEEEELDHPQRKRARIEKSEELLEDVSSSIRGFPISIKPAKKARWFLDPVHGLKALSRNERSSEELWRFIDTPEFQRLRDLHQLGTTYHVYIGATHSRFEHSLGTCYLVGHWVKLLREKGWEIDDRTAHLIQLAALCHDLGHGPFSHAFENVVENFDHAHVSCLIFELINQRLGSPLNSKEVLLVQRIITGDPIDGYSPAIFQIVCNRMSGLDADKIDYMLRDCFMTGQNMVTFSRKILFSCSFVDAAGNIAFFPKYLRHVADVYKTRQKLHTDVYNHPAAKATELMICAALRASESYFGFTRIVQDGLWPQFCAFTDHVLRDISRRPQLKEANALLQRLWKRDLYKHVGTAVVIPGCRASLLRLKDALSVSLQEAQAAATVVVAKFDLSLGTVNPIDRILIGHPGEIAHHPGPLEVSTHLRGVSVVQDVEIRLFAHHKEDRDDVCKVFGRWLREFSDCVVQRDI